MFAAFEVGDRLLQEDDIFCIGTPGCHGPHSGVNHKPHLGQLLDRGVVEKEKKLGICLGVYTSTTRGALDFGGNTYTRYEDFCDGDSATAASLVRTRKTNVSWRYSRTRESVWLR